MNLITHKNKVYREFAQGPLVGYVEVPLPEVVPNVRYTGAKIPMELWHQVTAWFAKHKANEVQVRLYTDFKSWRAVPFPQTYPSGMTIREVADHPAAAALNASLAGWTHYGSVHHHCAMSAFQSGTDSNDEKGVAGLHITVGHMDKPTYDIHSRVSVKVFGVLSPDGSKVLSPATQGFYAANLADWFMLPPEAAALPEPLHEQVVKYYLTLPPTEVAYPSEWDAALIPPVQVTYYPMHQTTTGKYRGFQSKYDEQDMMEYYSGFNKAAYNNTPKQSIPPEYPALTEEEENLVSSHEVLELIEDLALNYHYSLHGLYIAWLNQTEGGMIEEAVAELNGILEEYDVSPSEFIDWMRDEGIADKEEEPSTNGVK